MISNGSTVGPHAAPTDPCAACLGRREFLSRGALAAAGAVLATALVGCGGGSDPTSPASVSLTVRVADYPALANVNGVAMISASGSPLAIVRTAADSFVALSLICPHRGCTIADIGSEFQCPCHGAMFTLSGTWAGGQQTSNMHGYPAAYDATSGVITVG